MSDDQTPKKPNDEFANENMQKRVNSLFSGNELPAYESMREVDAMKSRIRELETKLLTLSNHREMPGAWSAHAGIIAGIRTAGG